MPRWELHISITSMAALVVLTGAAIGLVQNGLSMSELREAFPFLTALALGSIAIVLGAVLPDIDGNGRIRWTIGPVMGAFGIVPPFIGRSFEEGLLNGMIFIYQDGARLFLLFTAIGFLFLLVPFKHRGKMHSILPAVIFGTAWGLYTWSCVSLGIEHAFLVGGLGTFGYIWHLAMDGKLTL